MPGFPEDICKCRSKECPSSANCYRFTMEAKPPYQSYANFFVERGMDKCGHFMDNTGEGV